MSRIFNLLTPFSGRGPASNEYRRRGQSAFISVRQVRFNVRIQWGVSGREFATNARHHGFRVIGNVGPFPGAAAAPLWVWWVVAGEDRPDPNRETTERGYPQGVPLRTRRMELELIHGELPGHLLRKPHGERWYLSPSPRRSVTSRSSLSSLKTNAVISPVRSA